MKLLVLGSVAIFGWCAAAAPQKAAKAQSPGFVQNFPQYIRAEKANPPRYQALPVRRTRLFFFMNPRPYTAPVPATTGASHIPRHGTSTTTPPAPTTLLGPDLGKYIETHGYPNRRLLYVPRTR